MPINMPPALPMRHPIRISARRSDAQHFSQMGHQGFGRFYRITEVALVFVAVGEDPMARQRPPRSFPSGCHCRIYRLPGNYTRQPPPRHPGVPVVNFFDPNFGMEQSLPKCQRHSFRSRYLQLNDVSMSMPSSASIPLYFNNGPAITPLGLRRDLGLARTPAQASPTPLRRRAQPQEFPFYSKSWKYRPARAP